MTFICIWLSLFFKLTFAIQFHSFLHLLYFSAKIGFIWNINEHAWNANFRALEAYHAEHVSIVVYRYYRFNVLFVVSLSTCRMSYYSNF